ncbi:site-specific DNA-methyltransferase [Paenibacillus albidus]|uniref:DNA-methyltransferase n=1 Tax=Paenibacillus albidus TaxID=2041023 RepID=UPI001BE83792|nr:site-specific DNA-methyltransferase [Paenibacillus albidus]MBT2289066.1 site-specific DNA-methyltransferase [Paenibacillus albidus]
MLPEQIYNNYFIGNSEKLTDYIEVNTPFIDLIVTSPPYWDAKQYGEVEQTGYGQTYESYRESMRKTFQGVYDLAKPTASLYVIIDTLKRNGKVIRLQDEICSILEEIGWIHQDTIIWDKGKTLPWSRKGQMRNIFEYVLFFTKTTNFKYNIESIKNVEELKGWWHDYPERYSPDGKVPDNIWRFNIPSQGSWGSKINVEDEEFRHACPFPPELMARIIKLSSDEGDVVFDPFAGTGVLLATAELMGRRYLGIDTNEQYKNVFEKVTKPLVANQWIDIERYYNLQESLKKIMKSSIRRLRMLKYPNALLKRLRKADLFNTIPWNFSIALAIEQPNLSNHSLVQLKKEKTIGEVHYYLVYEGNEHDKATVQKLVNELVSKAPFTKYGIITEVVKVISIGDLRNTMQLYNLDFLFLYSNGNIRSYSERITSNEIWETLDKNEHLKLFDKDIPPIYSNISLLKSEYSMIPAEKYEKKTLLTPYDELILELKERHTPSSQEGMH